jgi:hypothetical protein
MMLIRYGTVTMLFALLASSPFDQGRGSLFDGRKSIEYDGTVPDRVSSSTMVQFFLFLGTLEAEGVRFSGN